MDFPNNNFWKDLEKFILGRMLKDKKISAEDLHLFKIVDSVDAATAEIFGFYSNYHSIRYVGDRTVMRLQRPVTPAQLEKLNAEFKSILTPGGSFAATAPLREEENQPELAKLPRIVFPFNRINNGRLRQMIDFLNEG